MYIFEICIFKNIYIYFFASWLQMCTAQREEHLIEFQIIQISPV